MDLSGFLKKNYNEQDYIARMYINNPEYGTMTNYISSSNLAKKVTPEINAYMSMNPISFRNGIIKRNKSHVSKLKWLYVDLDYYKSEYYYMTKSQLLYYLQCDYFGQKIPYPTVIIDSGRGLYLLWKIEEHIKAIPKWYKMQNYIYHQLQELGADPQITTDTSRVFRQIGSVNSKSNTVVSILEYADNKYSLSSLIRLYLPEYDVATEKMILYANWISNTLGIPVPSDDKNILRKFIGEYKDAAEKDGLASHKMISYAKWISEILEEEIPGNSLTEIRSYIEKNKDAANLIYQMQKVKNRSCKKKVVFFRNEYTLYQARLKDLEILLTKHRDKEGGYRECILFLYRYYNLCITESKEISLDNTLKLNQMLHNPLKEDEVIKSTRSAEKYYDDGKVYRSTNKHIIDMLGINAAEMKDLHCLITCDVKKERKSNNNRKLYLKRLNEEGKGTKADQIKERRNELYKLLQQGKTRIEICNILKICKSTFYEEKKIIESTSFCDTNISDEKSSPITTIMTKKIPISSIIMALQASPKNSALDINRVFRPWRFCYSEELSASFDVLFSDSG